MRILSRVLGRPSQRAGIKDQLGYFGLGTWWISTFSPAEQEYMESAFATVEPPGDAGPLTTGDGLSGFPTAAALLTILADQLSGRPEDRSLARRVLAKAEERALAENDILGLHFTYHQMIRLHNRWKEHFADALDLAFAACHKQIRLAPRAAQAFREKSRGGALPTHVGYLHAANTLEQQSAYLRAIEICRQAESEGWSGNWSWRIQRMAKKLPGRSGPFRSISESGMGRV